MPIVYPLIVYSGDKKWNAPLDIFELFGSQSDLARTILFQPYQLIDVARIEDHELKKHVWSGILEFALKYRQIRNLSRFFDVFLPWLGEIERNRGEEFCKILLNYTIDGLEADDTTLFEQKVDQYLSNKLRGEAMTIAERLKQEGAKQGLQQGLELVASRLIEQGSNIEFIAKATGLKIETIKEIEKKTKH